jgi:hypothetical protein
LSSQWWGRLHEVKKRRTERATNLEHMSFGSKGHMGECFAELKEGSGQFDRSNLGDLISGCSWESSRRTKDVFGNQVRWYGKLPMMAVESQGFARAAGSSEDDQS